MRHLTALLWATLAGAALGVTGGTASALADVPGFGVRVAAPATVKAGGTTKTLTAVATSEQRRCQKVRWTLVVRGGDVPLDRIRVTRFEDTGEFPTQVSIDGDTATVVDRQLDPGSLCRGRTVTGRWRIGVAGRDGGQVRFEVRAVDVAGTVLGSGAAASEVTGVVATSSPSPRPSRTSASPEPTEEEELATAGPGIPTNETTSAAALTPASSNDSNLLGPGLIAGGVFFFLGLVLLLRLRARTREARRRERTAPTGFYTMP
ncbi:hypothetical protein [Actinoplanes siamensis]|uniref:Uncharacterized protein n=1 Tax=Actinoplanes siamensis TaxID=1223317 RepID=A0A919N4E6_9ACTN|nr:hypothetical protein [Actinoplanes siamensis]GIF04156.1 hypothetical protein Asi03nite_16940 [Actinoplanes siamensis]